jgi:O-antigen/teichoic acid export membrane protein
LTTDNTATTNSPGPQELPEQELAVRAKRRARGKAAAKSPYRDLLKHSSIYGLGALLTRLASVLLLPFYTSYLPPADYGRIQILDLTSFILVALIAAGPSVAVTRYHFEAKSDRERSRVWWTGMAIVTLLATVLIAPAWAGRDTLARLTLGADEADGGYFYQLILITTWFDAIGQMLDAYLRVRKWSALFVGSSFVSFLLNIALNVWFLAGFDLGIAGVLLGNLISCALRRLFLLGLLMYSYRSYSFDWPLWLQLMKFGSPIIVTGLLTLVMRQADRYLLLPFVSMDEIGIYSLAASMGQGLYSLFILPFSSIWSVVMYEIAEQPQAKKIYAQVFQYFVYCELLLFLGVSLFAERLIRLLATGAYKPAASLIPIVCLAYLFFSLHEHFKVPALLTKRTLSLLPAFMAASGTSIGANLCLIPVLGVVGAAWVSVLTFAVFSFVGLWRYRLIDKYPYPFFRCGIVLVGMIGTFIASRLLSALGLSGFWLLAAQALLWCGWAAVLLGRVLRLLAVLRPVRSHE